MSIKSKLPQGLRNAIRPEIYLLDRLLLWRRLVDPRYGALPSFLIIGTQKAGTTTLYDAITQHPEVVAARTKEVGFFDRHYSLGTSWYKLNFPRHAYSGEATPGYIFDERVPQRIADTLGTDIKMIVLLRNPVDRLLSHYFHEVRLGAEKLDLLDALEAEPGRIAVNVPIGRPYEGLGSRNRYSYFSRGLYAEQLRRFYALFPQANIHVETSERFFAQPHEVLTEVYEFLGLPPFENTGLVARNQGSYTDQSRHLDREKFEALYAEPNRDLAKLLGRPPLW